MFGRNRFSVISAALALTLLLMMALGGCGMSNVPTQTAEIIPEADPADTVEPAAQPESETESGRQDGERFEDVIILEGMEETVRYEHVRNDTIGFEMDYDYERFERHSSSDRESFVSDYDLPDDLQNYLEVTYSPRDAETVAEAIGAALSLDYEIIKEPCTLERAGSCIRIDASSAADGSGTPDKLQMVYIIPAADGCRIAAAHYGFESAEGIGRRFSYFMNTFSVLAAQGEKRISDEQALAAVKTWCHICNPDLASIEKAGEYPVYWEIASSDEHEIVVLFRSYTGALIRYYIDPISGETYVTEFVSGVTDGEERTDESLNVWDYLY